MTAERARAPSAPLVIEQPTSWSDMDAFGHVNNAVYLRWFENARFHYFREVGLTDGGDEPGLGPILARAEVDYLAPVRFPERLSVSTAAVELGRTSFVLAGEIRRLDDGRPVARGRFVIVTVDDRAGGRPIPIPARLRAAIVARDQPAERAR